LIAQVKYGSQSNETIGFESILKSNYVFIDLLDWENNIFLWFLLLRYY